MFRIKSLVLALSLALALAPAPASAATSYYAPAPVTGGSGATPIGPWLIFGCASFIILAAMTAYRRDGRELTSAEAISCGFGYWLRPR